MNLRTRVRLLVLVSALVSLALLEVFLAAYLEKTGADRDLALSESLTAVTLQLRTVLFGHLLSPHTQPQSQVEAQFKIIADLLGPGTQSRAASDAQDADTRYAWEGARRMVGDLRALLADLDAAGTDPRLNARGRQTTERILMDSDALILFVSQIRNRTLDRIFQASTREKRALGLLLVGLAVIGLGLLLLVERSLLSPIERLRQAVIRIGGGATALRLETRRRDELGQLANAFDHLLDQIRETTVSRDRLQVEVDERARAQTRFQCLVDANMIGVAVADAAGHILEANDYYLNLVGWTRADLAAGRVDWREVTPPEWLPADEQALAELNRRGVCTPYEKEYVRADGSRVAILITDAMLPGTEQHILGLGLDMTERWQAAEALRQSEERFRTLAETVPQIVWMTRADGWCIYFNQRWVDYTGRSLEESYGHGWTIPFHPDDRRRAWDAWQLAVQTDGVYALECRLRRADGVYRWWLIRGVSLHDAKGQVVNWFGTCTDITAIKEHERELEHIAHFDALTGLPNRVLLADRLHQAMVQAQRRARPAAVVLLDLDGFKTINDSHGHEAGDQFLIAMAVRLRQALREGDTVARLGGDEFVAVLPDLANTQDSVPLLTRLLDAAAQPVAAGDRVLQVSASLGVTFYPQAEDIDADQLLRQADQAMYQAKLAGKNCYHFFDAERAGTGGAGDRRLDAPWSQL
jgi:diguanylate cyclase (GGDEF)-like protein/PAS domain S-box-containing protein